MIKLKENYLKILAIEFEDLREDINILIEQDNELRDKREVSHYVYMENLATLNREIMELDKFSAIIDAVNIRDYENLDALVADLRQQFTAIMHEYALPAGVISLVERKMDKVYSYIVHCPESK